MESRLVKLKSDFNNIINIRNNVKNIFDTLQVRIDRLRQIYSEFIENNKVEMFVFGLDSFHFQSKLIDIEYDDMKRLFLVINNRMYCEYFKLHKMITEYITKNFKENKNDLIKNSKYPVYRDLEPFKEYKFEIVLDIHENILNLLSVLNSLIINKENELFIHKTKQNIGLNIDNFITSFNFNISVMREKIVMFIEYVEFFHKMHSKYLKRFSNKIQLMYTHISNDIKFDDTIEISKNKKKELIDEFNANNVDKKLLKELKTSIGSETNSDAGSENETNTPPNTPEINKNDEKKDYKKIFQRSVNKVSNNIGLFKSKNEDIEINDKFNDKNIHELFYGIEKSCDSIIYENPGLKNKLSIIPECISNNNLSNNVENLSDIDNSDINIVNDDNSINENNSINDINIFDDTITVNDSNIDNSNNVNHTTIYNSTIVNKDNIINNNEQHKKKKQKKKRNNASK